MDNIMNINKKTRLINMITITLIVVCFAFLFIMPFAKADNASTALAWANQICQGTNKSINEAMTSSLYTGMTSETLGAEYNIINIVYDALKIIGALWVIVIAMTHLITNIDKGQDPVESVFKVLIEIGITFLFLMNMDELVGWICKGGNAIIDIVGSASDQTDAFTGADLLIALTGASSGGFGWFMSALGALILPYGISYLIAIVSKFLIYQIVVEIGIRRAFCPMAIADIYQDGLRSPGVRYFKKLLACFVKLAVCCLVAQIVGPMMGSLDADMSTAESGCKVVLECLVINFTSIGLMLKAGEYANDILGV